MKPIRERLTYANVMSTIAVFLVVGGATAFGAAQLGKNSVGARQLKTNAVTTAKIKKNAVTAAKIKKNAVTTAKIKDDACSDRGQGERGHPRHRPELRDHLTSSRPPRGRSYTRRSAGDRSSNTARSR